MPHSGDIAQEHSGPPIAYCATLGALLFASALPDAMVVPLLRQLLVTRYDVSVGAAHLFMTVNVVGGLAGVLLIGPLRRALGGRQALAVAAGANALLLALMALPIGFVPTLALRSIEGAADLMVYAYIFDMIAQAGAAGTRGRRMGGAVTCMMLGIAAGIGLGGFVGREVPTLALVLGATACCGVMLGALALLRTNGTASHDGRRLRGPRAAGSAAPGVLWPALVMMFNDRALAALLATTVPLYLASVVGLDSARAGIMIALAIFVMALAAWPAGRLSDRLGVPRLRLFGGVLYAGGIAALPVVAPAGMLPLAALMFTVGLGGAGLFASSLHLVSRSSRGSAGMGAYCAAGNLGFVAAPLIAGWLLTTLGGTDPKADVYAIVISAFAGLHLLSTFGTVAATKWALEPRRTETRPTFAAQAG